MCTWVDVLDLEKLFLGNLNNPTCAIKTNTLQLNIWNSTNKNASYLF